MATLKSDSGGNSSESINGSYCFIHDNKPCKGNSSSTGCPDTKWWLKHRGLGRVYSHDQLNVSEADVKLIEEYYTTYPKNDAAFCSDMPLKHFYSHCKNNGDSWLQEFESTINEDLLSNARLMDLDSCNCLLLERPEKLCSDMDSHWVGLKKTEPWWHAADKDDLASLVSQASSHHVKSCDCPGVKSVHIDKVSDNSVIYFDQFEEQMTGKETKFSLVSDNTQVNLASGSMDNSPGKQGLMECTQHESDGTFSKDSFKTAKADSSDAQEPTSSNLSRAELLEALCHSQTRAREAENLAQEACDEKDRIINLFFRQASCLFAYRQWLRVLQLETLCLHLRSKDQLSSFAASPLLPWVRSQGEILRKNRCRAAKQKPSKQRGNTGKRAVAFAVGLSLAGAGLLVGWTLGWLFSAL